MFLVPNLGMVCAVIGPGEFFGEEGMDILLGVIVGIVTAIFIWFGWAIIKLRDLDG